MIARIRVQESHRLTPTIHAVKFEKPPGFEFAPVQFCGLELSTPEGPIEYPMSLACSPTKPYLEFGARVSDSAWKRAFSSLAPGDEAEVDGAFGHFLLREKSPAVLIAGGIGITPLKGMIEYATDLQLPIDVRLLYSNRTEEEISFRPELERLADQNPRFEMIPTLTREVATSPWTGRRGRIDAELIERVSQGLKDPVFYLCGTPGMVQDTYRTLLGLRVPPQGIVYEAFRGY